MSNKVSITIDGKKLEVEQGRTVLEVCDELGIKIPTPLLEQVKQIYE